MDENLESINKLRNDIKSAKLISCFLPGEQREKINEMKMQFKQIIETIDLFNQYFSDMGWCL